MQSFAEAGDDLILHVRLRSGTRTIMASGAPASLCSAPQGFSVQPGLQDLAEARRVFDSLAEGGRVVMAFGPIFWAGFGSVTDRYGNPWMINCDQPKT